MEIKQKKENFANLFVCVLTASNIGLKDKKLLMTGLRTLPGHTEFQGGIKQAKFYLQQIRKALFIIKVFKNDFNIVLKINYKV